MGKQEEVKGHLLAFVTVFIWGTTFVSTKVLLTVMTPVEILFIRFVIGFVVLMLAYPHRLKVKDRKEELYFAAAGICGVTLYYLLENIALTYTLASNVGVIVTVAPFFTAVFANWFLAGEKPRLLFYLGFVIAAIGVFLISFNGSVQFQWNPLGDILAVFAAIVWAAYSILTKKISEFQYNTIQTTRRVFFYGLMFMVPALFLFGFRPNISQLLQPMYFGNMLFLGLGASALCFVTWNTAVKMLGAVKTSVYIYMVPVITVVTSVAVLGETITGLAVLGTILTLIGLVLSENKFFIKNKK